MTARELEVAGGARQPARGTLAARLSLVLAAILAAAPAEAQEATPMNVTIERDGLKLAGRFFPAAAPGERTAVLLLHGFPGNEADVLGLCAGLAAGGFHALTFNYSGTFGSDGEWSMENTQADVAAALDRLRGGELGGRKIGRVVLGGYSYGGEWH